LKWHVLFGHGGGEGAYEADERLVASLRDTLGSEYDVRSPTMPGKDSLEYEAWKEEVTRELAAMEGEAILFAAPYVGTGGWEVEEDALREDFAAKLAGGPSVFLHNLRDARARRNDDEPRRVQGAGAVDGPAPGRGHDRRLGGAGARRLHAGL
jgi:hypothetical protein